MTPREFVEDLRHISSEYLRVHGLTVKDLRLMEIEGWLFAEAKESFWGAGGRAFVLHAKKEIEANTFEQWLDGLKSPTEKR